MAVSVIERPLGFILGECVEATIDEQYGGYATVNSVHGFSDGDYVYIDSNVESYNGFWYVNIEGTDYFKIRRYATDTDQDYIVDATITYCPVISTHGISCVHLPITYRLRSNLSPSNEVSTSRTISSFGNDNGYVCLTLSGSIDDGAFPEPYEFIKISGSTSLDGVYQIIEVINPTTITIDLIYDSTYSFGSATVLRHYNNYNINVRVYGGLNADHAWVTKKPFELLATLNLIPDVNNEVFFSIADILKSQVFIKNNLTLDTLPINLDAFTEFYISVAESYDDSLGSQYILSTYESEFTDDSFEGMAVNAKLPFKNIHSGNLSEYVMYTTSSKFLTLFSILTFFSCSEEDCYSDISFINRFDNTRLYLRKTYFIDDVEQTTTNDDLGVQDKGLVRAPIGELDCNFDYVNLSVLADPEVDDTDNFQETGTGDGTFSLVTNNDLSAVNQVLSVTLNASEQSKIAYWEVNLPPGSYYFGSVGDVTVLSGAGTYTIIPYALDENLNILDTGAGGAVTAPNPDSNSDLLTSTKGIKYIGLRVNFASGTGQIQMDFYPFINTEDGLPITVSEVKRMDINCDCANQTIRLSWLNYLGGFEYFAFTGEKDHTVEIEETGETNVNTFVNWPRSYGEHSDTIKKNTFRKSRKGQLVRSQYLTEAQLEAIQYIKTSPLVQIVNSRTDRRTVLVDSDSFTVKKDRQDLFEITFTILFTDEIPSQS